MPAGLRGQPAGHVGQLGPGPWLRAGRRQRLEHGVFDALGAAVGQERRLHLYFGEVFLSPGVWLSVGSKQEGQGAGSGVSAERKWGAQCRGKVQPKGFQARPETCSGCREMQALEKRKEALST